TPNCGEASSSLFGTSCFRVGRRRWRRPERRSGRVEKKHLRAADVDARTPHLKTKVPRRHSRPPPLPWRVPSCVCSMRSVFIFLFSRLRGGGGFEVIDYDIYVHTLFFKEKVAEFDKSFCQGIEDAWCWRG
ncbi:unnamed protein product, partial [Ixodes pacificus]